MFRLARFVNYGLGQYGWNQRWSGHVAQDVARPQLSIQGAQMVENGGLGCLMLEDASVPPTSPMTWRRCSVVELPQELTGVVGGVLAAILAGGMRTKATTAAGQFPGHARAPLRDRLEQIIHTIFTTSYIHAMRTTLLIPAVLLLVCAASSLLLIRPRRATASTTRPPTPRQ